MSRSSGEPGLSITYAAAAHAAGGCESREPLNRPVGQARQNASQIFPDRNLQPATAFHDG